MDWIQVRSPFITALHHDPETGTLTVCYGSGRVEAFAEVPRVEVANLIHAPSLKEQWERHDFVGRYTRIPTDHG